MNRFEKHEGIDIDLKRLFAVLCRRAWAILLTGVICAALVCGYALFFIAPRYAASIQLYVNNNYVDSPGFSSSQIAAAQDLADTYMVIMRSRNVLSDVVAKSGLNYSYEQVRKMISAASVNETEVFEVEVICGDPRHAAILANAIADVLPDKIAAVVEGSSVRVVDRAVENPNPVGPKYNSYLVLGAMVGVVLSALIAIIADVTDTTIKSEEYLTQVYGKWPLLAVIPGTQSGKSSYKGYYESTKPINRSKKSGGAGK